MPLRIGRLRKRSEFSRVASTGRKSAAKGLILQALDRGDDHSHSDPNPSAQAWIGITVSRRVGGAVQRNRVKRRLRAAAVRIFPTQATVNFDYVLIGRKATLTRTFPALLSDLETLLHRLSPEHSNSTQENP